MEQKELKVTGIFYLTMLKGETQGQAEERFEKLLEQSRIIPNSSCCEFEEQEL